MQCQMTTRSTSLWSLKANQVACSARGSSSCLQHQKTLSCSAYSHCRLLPCTIRQREGCRGTITIQHVVPQKTCSERQVP